VRNILLDSNAYTAFKLGKLEAVEILRHAPLIGIDSIASGELLGGFAHGAKDTWNRRQFEEFCSSDRVRRLSVDERTAEHYARIYGDLRRQGRPIPTNDMWIAASALRHDFGVFTYDGHFQFIADLTVGKTVEDFLI
jgi:tRNA(fMet)-specific endonuclease VapC